MTHRRLDDVLASSIRLGLTQTRMHFDSTRDDAEIDRQMVVGRRSRVTDAQVNRIVKFRRAHPDVPVIDVLYDDCMTKPIDTVRRIYNHFGLTWSEGFEENMLTWLRENPQGKQGRHAYKLEEFGLTHEAIEQRYEDYNKMFLKSEEPLKKDDDMAKSANSALEKVDIAANGT